MKIRMVLFAALLLLAASNVQAQHHGRPHGPGLFGAIDEMSEALNLTESQQSQLQTLKEQMDAEMKTLHDQDFEDKDARREAFHQTMTSYKEKVDAILTDEQESLLKAKRKEAGQKRREQMEKIDRQGLKDALMKHHEEEVLPVLLAKRAEFEKELSAEDQAKLAELRTNFDAKRAAHKAKREEMRQQMKEKGERPPHPPKGDHRAHGAKADDPDHQAVKALVEKYDAQLTAVMEELAPQQESWKKEREAILQQFAPEGAPEKGKGRHHGKFGHKGMNKAHFLLLDPNATPATTDKASVVTAAKAYPNPASSEMTLSYELKQAGTVKIELRNESGGTVKVLENTSKAAGTQQLNVDVSGLRDGVYYLAIISGGQQSVVKAIVAKQ